MTMLLRRIAAILALSLIPGFLCGCSDGLRLVNEMSFGLADVREVKISYDEEDIAFFESPTDQLVIREYMTADGKRYRAKVSHKGNAVHVSEGGRPLFDSGFERSVQVFLPASYGGMLVVTSTSGRVDTTPCDIHVARLQLESTSGDLSCGDIFAEELTLSSTSGRIDCRSLSGAAGSIRTTSGPVDVRSVQCGELFSVRTTSGALAFGSILAGEIGIETTSGAVTCGQLEGGVTYRTTSGSLAVAAASGSGSYETGNSGALDIAYDQVTGDLSLYNKNDDIRLALPGELSFSFEARTGSGSITTDFQEFLTADEGGVRGTVGGSPSASIRLETAGGDILVTR